MKMWPTELEFMLRPADFKPYVFFSNAMIPLELPKFLVVLVVSLPEIHGIHYYNEWILFVLAVKTKW